MSSPGKPQTRAAWSRAVVLPCLGAVLLAMGCAVAAVAQYPGRIAKTDKDKQVLRSVAVLEWTGEAGKPSASRLVPVAVYDGEQLNDGTIYMNRPEPLALASGVEYELQKDGRATGLFDVFGAGELNGSWQGVGVWKPLTVPEAAQAKAAFNTSGLYGHDDAIDDDKPVLKRKHPTGTDSDDNASGSGSAGNTSAKQTSASGAGSSGPGSSKSDDPDRPTLKRKSSGDSSSNGTSNTGSSSTSAAGVDPDRPTLHRSHHAANDGMPETSTAAPDPDRPRLTRGKPAGLEATEIPALKGLPPSMQQAVAVSDAGNRTEHPWKYTWADPADEGKMKGMLEEIARKELGLDAPAAPPAKPARGTGARKKTSLLAAQPAEPAPLADVQFRIFELTYGATATMVYSASTPLPEQPEQKTPDADSSEAPKIVRTPGNAQKTAPKQTQVHADSDSDKNTTAAAAAKPPLQKYVTLVAQPDLYGGVLVLYKSVTDSAHLDDKPRMRLIDAVDAMGDNRGELLFELRGKTQRQFALFRVLRGSAEQLFATVAMP